jgi:3-deoxy-D-manno-octulosonic-acid transferase
VLVGPHTDNFREAVALLVDAGAGVVVTDAASMAAELKALLSDPVIAAKRGEAGAEAVAARHGAVAATLELVERYLLSGGRS